MEHNYIIESKIFDVYLPQYNLLIEYNGDYWHCNPNKYNTDYINNKKNMTAKEIWEYDKDKIYLAEKNGYYCEVIWESDYKQNKHIILEIIRKYDKK
jgi:G:T-mismatch repair DNA endonuclease (very short patch repair protein)